METFQSFWCFWCVGLFVAIVVSCFYSLVPSPILAIPNLKKLFKPYIHQSGWLAVFLKGKLITI